MVDRSHYPRPKIDADNAPFFQAWTQGKLRVQRCDPCDKLIFPPRVHCPYCWNNNLDWEALSGDGRIVSFALVYRPNHQAFFDEAPLVFAELCLNEKVTMEARVLAADPLKIRSGDEVALVQGEEAASFPLPTFRVKSKST